MIRARIRSALKPVRKIPVPQRIPAVDDPARAQVDHRRQNFFDRSHNRSPADFPFFSGTLIAGMHTVLFRLVSAEQDQKKSNAQKNNKKIKKKS